MIPKRKVIVQKGRRAAEKLWCDIQRCRTALILLAIYGAVTQILFGTVCPFKIVIGLDCPGCGLTRGALCVLTGQWKRAVSYNAMSFAWVMLIAWLLWERYFTEKEKVPWELPVILTSLATILVWILPVICRLCGMAGVL